MAQYALFLHCLVRKIKHRFRNVCERLILKLLLELSLNIFCPSAKTFRSASASKIQNQSGDIFFYCSGRLICQVVSCLELMCLATDK